MKKEIRKKLIDTTTKLCLYKSDKDRKNERLAVLKYIDRYVKAKIPQIKRKEFESNGIVSYYLYNPQVQGKEIMLCGHIDVIPAEDEQFEVKVKNNKLYARGSADMKSGVAILMELFMKYAPQKNVTLLLTSDEEIGSANGAKIVAQNINPDVVIITEPSQEQLIIKEKGACWIDINVTAPGGHASRPWQAQNAVDILLDIIGELRKQFPHPKEEAWVDTMNVGCIKGGNLVVAKENILHGAGNVIADAASVRLDFRLIETTPHDDIFETVNMVLDEKNASLSEEYKIKSDVVTHVEHMDTALHDPYVKALLKKMETNGIEVTKMKEHGASDGRYFSQKDIPVLVFGPKGENHHGVGEYVDIDSVEKVYNVLDEYIQDL